jgi:DNA-binding NtrC family response regulator
VILDFTIPGGMGGRETMEKIISMDPDAKGIVCSGYSSEDVLGQCASSGFKDFISKPYGFDDLQDTLRRVLSAE